MVSKKGVSVAASYPRWLITMLAIALGESRVGADTLSVRLTALDSANEPVQKADVSLFLRVQDGTVMTTAAERIVTDAAGKAVLLVEDWNEKRPVLVLSADRKLGGIVGVSKANDGQELTVTLGPTVRMKGKFECKELNTKPARASAVITPDGFRPMFAQYMSNSATFELVLPVGKYKVSCSGIDLEPTTLTATLSADRLEHDFGAINLRPTMITRLKGKPLPEWVIADARGVKADVKLAEYRGKWVYLDFWGFWCGPCCAGSLPELIGLYEDHIDHRDKFEVFAIHDKRAKSFAQLDAKLKNIKLEFWQGKDLRFPVVLDANGTTERLYGVREYPTGLLIDPDGKLVGEASADELEAKLPPLSAAIKWKRHRDMYKNVFWSCEPSVYTLRKFVKILSIQTRCTVELDEEAAMASGLTLDGPLPGVVIGMPITVRSVEELLLHPHGLGVVPAKDDDKLLVTRRTVTEEEPSYFQKLHFKALTQSLDGVSPDAAKNETKPVEVKEQPLLAAIKRIVKELDLPLAFDAKAMLTRTLDPMAPVSGTVVANAGLRHALTKMVGPLGLKVEVRSEVVLLTPRDK
jgi:thiol-disulfide isomerase/thioredoxin